VRIRRSLAAIVASGVIALAGCGGGDGSSEGGGGRADQLAGSALTFTAATIDGEPFDAADLAGSPAVFWFWAPWCSTCVAEAPHVLDLAEKHGDAVNIVGVASLGTLAEMKDFIELTATESLTHLNDEPGAVWQHFEITPQSTFAVVDASGEVVDSGYFEPQALADQLAALVG
jgi:thiol-disulfide isomerase/thioredoxin